MAITFGEAYAGSAARIATTVGTGSAAELARPVPACPEWDVHDLVAHLVGGAADWLDHRLDGFPGPAWSARQVAERRDWDGARLRAALLAQAPAVAALCDTMADGPNNAWDVLVHEQDLDESRDATSRVLHPGWDLVLDSGLRVLAAGRGVRLEPTSRPADGPWGLDLTVGPVTAHTDGVDAYELMRAVFSRRTVDEMAGWGWDHDVSEVVAGLAFFGPARPAATAPGPR